ncbi:hypothetical protein PM082_022248 [Marasmius tenuissimus]|nr:hypothetical protein PM082_022248 [Marasmius tenuissimus]
MVYKFSTDAGRTLCRKILLETIKEDPHDHQLETVTKALDGIDVLSIVQTSRGKSGYIYMTVTIILKILEDPSLCPEASFPSNPTFVVVCPTTSLEDDLVRVHALIDSE